MIDMTITTGREINLVPDPDADEPNWPLERCCFCKTPSRTWAHPQDVACCQSCASTRTPADLPTKKEWLAAAQPRVDRMFPRHGEN